jgi:hypothetical protein
MHTRRYRSRKNRTRKMTGGKKWGGKTGKKWTTAIEAAQKTLSKTGSIQAAKKSLRRQALTNARKLFGSVGSV